MDAWVGILAIVAGLASCFYGYPLFRLFLILAGLIGGYLIGLSFVEVGHERLALAVGIIAALVLAVLAYPLWSIGVLVAGAALGFMILGSVAIALNASQAGVMVMGAAGGAAVGFLFFGARDLFVMLTTALGGAVETVFGLGVLLPPLDFRAGEANFLAVAAVVLLGSFGFAAQYRMFKDRRQYSGERRRPA
jgi:hypothetical protein